MPSASEALRRRWKHNERMDRFAIDHLRQRHFTWKSGIIRPPKNYQPTAEDYSAIDYLVFEWDYGYDPQPDKTIDA